MLRFMALIKRDIGNLPSSPVLLLYNTLFPFLMTLILGFLGNGDYSGSGVNAYDYYGVSIMVFMLLNVSITAANTFMEHTLRNANLRAIHAPIPRSWTYLSKIASTSLFTGTCFLVMMALNAFALGVDYGGAMAGYVVALMLAFNVMSAALGVLFCCIFKSEEVANKILSFLTGVMAIFGGMFFQLDGFGPAAALISRLSPARWVLDGMFHIVYDGNLSGFLPALFSLLGLAALCVLGSKCTFRTEDYV
jgi:ABC-2 type transport system permease protein